jgi:hypothetical protein
MCHDGFFHLLIVYDSIASVVVLFLSLYILSSSLIRSWNFWGRQVVCQVEGGGGGRDFRSRASSRGRRATHKFPPTHMFSNDDANGEERYHIGMISAE